MTRIAFTSDVHTIRVHTAPRPATAATFGELASWLDQRLEAVEQDLADDETAQANGSRLRERRATLLDVAYVVQQAVAAEAVEQAAVAHEESIEQQYKTAGYGDMQPTIAPLMDGDR